MDTELVRTFLEVNKTRHFGRAAENLFLTQAAVSARIKQLEDYLGVSLFIRSRNNIQLTSEGERLIPHAETMQTSWSRIRQEISLKQNLNHYMAIGSTPGLWNMILRTTLSGIHKEMPNMALRAEAHSDTELLRQLDERVIDLAILYEPARAPNLKAKSLGEMKLVLANIQPNMKLQEALNTNYVFVDWGTHFGVFHAKNFPNLAPAILNTNMATIAESFILSEKGSAYLPLKLLKTRESPLQQVVGAPEFSKEIYAVYRTSAENIDSIEAVVKQLELSLELG
ncbi:MAG: DNA-binding transcriptional LysR family regulator [Pseudohongiellaceae bacterium]|jgi:DNA-binding transcriptional LysR family regulator